MSRTFRIDPAGARLESGLIDRSFSGFRFWGSIIPISPLL